MPLEIPLVWNKKEDDYNREYPHVGELSELPCFFSLSGPWDDGV